MTRDSYQYTLYFWIDPFSSPQEDKEAWWLPYYRLSAIQGNINMDLEKICEVVTSRWLKVWNPGNAVVIDESIYEYLGESPVHVSVPSASPLRLTLSQIYPKKAASEWTLIVWHGGIYGSAKAPNLTRLGTALARSSLQPPSVAPGLGQAAQEGPSHTISTCYCRFCVRIVHNNRADAAISVPTPLSQCLRISDPGCGRDCPLNGGRTALR